MPRRSLFGLRSLSSGCAGFQHLSAGSTAAHGRPSLQAVWGLRPAAPAGHRRAGGRHPDQGKRELAVAHPCSAPIRHWVHPPPPYPPGAHSPLAACTLLHTLQGGTVVNADRQFKADVLIRDGLILKVAPGLKVRQVQAVRHMKLLLQMEGRRDQHQCRACVTLRLQAPEFAPCLSSTVFIILHRLSAQALTSWMPQASGERVGRCGC